MPDFQPLIRLTVKHGLGGERQPRRSGFPRGGRERWFGGARNLRRLIHGIHGIKRLAPSNALFVRRV